jgi:hypothetical protein
MGIGNYVILALGFLTIVFFPIACYAIVNTNQLTKYGKIIRFIEILFFPLMGSILVLIEILYRRDKAGSKQ